VRVGVRWNADPGALSVRARRSGIPPDDSSAAAWGQLRTRFVERSQAAVVAAAERAGERRVVPHGAVDPRLHSARRPAGSVPKARP
jgi:hypothetical protein